MYRQYSIFLPRIKKGPGEVGLQMARDTAKLFVMPRILQYQSKYMQIRGKNCQKNIKYEEPDFWGNGKLRYKGRERNCLRHHLGKQMFQS
jgi:hypothetical protein